MNVKPNATKKRLLPVVPTPHTGPPVTSDTLHGKLRHKTATIVATPATRDPTPTSIMLTPCTSVLVLVLVLV